MKPAGKDIIYQGNTLISVEILPGYSHPVAIKKPFGPDASRHTALSLEKEFTMTRALDEVEGVRKAFEQKSIEGRPVLILEYIKGRVLKELVARGRLDLRSRLEIAVEISRIIKKIHQADIIHLDINSDNIIVSEDPGTVKLIDLGSAFLFDGNTHRKVGPEQALGTPAYISPEQTGKINRALDERSDLYSLGVVLYELMSGRLPFASDEARVVIHQHITRVPVSLTEVSPGIPAVINAIVLKLLSKDVEDRYQSAAGVRHDLEKCLAQLEPDGSVTDFPLAEKDRYRRFKYPQKLYGREAELKQLEDMFDYACRENSSIVFVAGYSGIGKTVLIEELQSPVSEQNGYFIRGKYGQYLNTMPYAAIAQALGMFVSRILGEPEDSFRMWRERIQSAVGSLGKVLTDVIPTLEEVIGRQPEVPGLGGLEAENRFNYIFLSFLSEIATKGDPLVLFLDDLQWIDAASLRLLEVIHAEFDQAGLLVIGAYRDNEVDDSHPLTKLISGRAGGEMRLSTMQLDNLSLEHIERLLSDAMGLGGSVGELGAVIHEKTLGNPFFSRRLLSSLGEEERITFDPETGRWKWDLEKINTETIADNVASLLAETIAQLPEETRDILNLAACLGNRFDISTLRLVSDLTENEIIRLLDVSLGGQYVLGSEGSYEFVHDQIQKTAYLLKDESGRAVRHLNIGRSLLAGTDGPELEDRIFDIVNQYNRGVDLLTDHAEKIRLADLNLLAGRKSKRASAFSASVDYLRQSAALLDDNYWQDDFRLMLDVHNELIDASYLTIQYGEVEKLFETITAHVEDNADLRVAYRAMIMSNTAENRLSESITFAERYLDRLGIAFDNERESDLSVEELYLLPAIEDKEKAAALEILIAITTPIIFSAPERLPSLVFTMLNIISRYGDNAIAASAYAWYATNLCFAQNYAEGNLFGQLAVDLLGKYPGSGSSSQVINMHCAWIKHWTASVHDLIEPLKTYHEVGLQEGDFEWCLYCLLNYTLLLWGTGKPLDEYLTEVGPAIHICKSKNQEVTLNMFLLFAQSALNLTSRSGSTTRLEGEWFSEAEMLPGLEGNHLLLTLYHLLRMNLSYLFGESTEAYRHIGEALKYRGSLNPHYLYSKISFFGGLSCISLLAESDDEPERREAEERLVLFERELKLWAETAPMNYGHQYDLLLAEKHSLADEPWQAVEFYSRSIRGAGENRFVHDEALANELFSRFWMKSGDDRIAGIFMREARSLYHRWGAGAKVHHLESMYPEWFVDVSSAGIVTIKESVSPMQLTLDGIISISHSLCSETDLDRLLNTMMRFVLLSSGASRSVLLMKQGSEWLVQARGGAVDERYDILVNEPFEPSDEETDTVSIPRAVFDYCRRTGKVFVAMDAKLDSRLAMDMSVQAGDIRSLACIPVMSQGNLKAMLYLENDKMADVFSLDRVEILEHLASQFGISMENALLYEELNRKIAELKQSQERYELAVAGSAAGIWDWDIEADRIFYSDRFQEMLGYEPDEFTNSLSEFWDRIHPDDHDRSRLAVQRHLEERIPYLVDFRLRNSSGAYRWFHSRGQALWDDDGKAVRMSGSLSDITERKQAEEKLTRSEERFRSLMEQSPLAIEILSPDGKIVRYNKAWLKLWGIDSEEAAQVAASYNMITDPQVRELGVLPLVERAFSGEAVILPPIHYRGEKLAEDIGVELSNPTTPWIQCHLYSIKDKGGKIVNVVNTYVDITELKLAEQEARENREALARIDRASSMGQLTGSISHELNQPLTGILSNAQAAELLIDREDLDRDELADIVSAIIADTKRAGEVIRNLREVYREQKGEFLPVDINKIVAETGDLMHSEFIIQNVTLTLEYAPYIPVVSGNKVQIQQVLVNILMNGMQAMSGLEQPESRLHVKTVWDGNEAKVLVEDNGPGIDADKIDRIFEPLATWKPGGTGMGLAISNTLIKAHGGRMLAENRPEGGARVGFTIPVTEEE